MACRRELGFELYKTNLYPEFLAIAIRCVHHTHLHHTTHHNFYCWINFHRFHFQFFFFLLNFVSGSYFFTPPSGLGGLPQKKPLC